MEKDEGFENLRAATVIIQCDSHPYAAMAAAMAETSANKLPQWLWPKVRILYYIYSAGFLALSLIGFAKMTIYWHS